MPNGQDFWRWLSSLPEEQRAGTAERLRQIEANWLRPPIELRERGIIPFTLAEAPETMQVSDYNRMIKDIMQRLGYYPRRLEELSMLGPGEIADLRKLEGLTVGQLRELTGQTGFGRLAPVERQFELALRNLPTEMQRIVKSNLQLEVSPQQVWEEALAGEEGAKPTIMEDFLSEWRRAGARPEEIRRFVPARIKQAFYAMPAAERGERMRGFAIGQR